MRDPDRQISIVLLLFGAFSLVCSLPSPLVDTKKCKKSNGYFPKSGSLCRSFYKCKNWIPVEMQCPSNQHFFPAKGYCVWPEEFPCLETPNTKHCPKPNGKFLKPNTHCKVYYDCCNGRPSKKKCPGDTLFDSRSSKCDWPELVACPDDPSKSKECPLANGKFLKPGSSCKYYYKCSNFKPTVKKCSGDTIFDQTRGKCDWPELVDCADDGTSTKKTFTSTLASSTRKQSPTPVSSTKEKISTITSNPTSFRTLTPDSDEDSSEEKSSEESKEYTTKHEIKSTYSTISTASSSIFEKITTPNLFTDDLKETFSTASSSIFEKITTPNVFTYDLKETSSSTEGKSTDFPVTSNKPSSTVAEKIITTTSNPSPSRTPITPDSDEDSSEEEESSEESKEFTTKYKIKSTYPTISTPSIFKRTTTPDVFTDDLKETSHSTKEKSTDFDVTSNKASSTVATSARTNPSITTVLEVSSTVSGISPRTTSSIDSTSYPAVVTDKTSAETSGDVSNKLKSTTVTTSSISDFVTSHIFCPKRDGIFPHPSNKRKFISCVGGNPIIMDCPSNLVYDHKTRSCQYKKKKFKLSV